MSWFKHIPAKDSYLKFEVSDDKKELQIIGNNKQLNVPINQGSGGDGSVVETLALSLTGNSLSLKLTQDDEPEVINVSTDLSSLSFVPLSKSSAQSSYNWDWYTSGGQIAPRLTVASNLTSEANKQTATYDFRNDRFSFADVSGSTKNVNTRFEMIANGDNIDGVYTVNNVIQGRIVAKDKVMYADNNMGSTGNLTRWPLNFDPTIFGVNANKQINLSITPQVATGTLTVENDNDKVYFYEVSASYVGSQIQINFTNMDWDEGAFWDGDDFVSEQVVKIYVGNFNPISNYNVVFLLSMNEYGKYIQISARKENDGYLYCEIGWNDKDVYKGSSEGASFSGMLTIFGDVTPTPTPPTGGNS